MRKSRQNNKDTLFLVFEKETICKTEISQIEILVKAMFYQVSSKCRLDLDCSHFLSWFARILCRSGQPNDLRSCLRRSHSCFSSNSSGNRNRVNMFVLFILCLSQFHLLRRDRRWCKCNIFRQSGCRIWARWFSSFPFLLWFFCFLITRNMFSIKRKIIQHLSFN